MGRTVHVRLSEGTKDFSLLHNSRPALGPTQSAVQQVLRKGGRAVKLTPNLHPCRKLRMSGTVPLHPYIPSWSGQVLYLFMTLKSVPVRGQTGTWALYDPVNSYTLLEVTRRGGGGGYKDAYICFHISLRQGLIFHKQLTQNSKKFSNVYSWNITVIPRNVSLECDIIWRLCLRQSYRRPTPVLH
jgi:hypothetical protein